MRQLHREQALLPQVNLAPTENSIVCNESLLKASAIRITSLPATDRSAKSEFQSSFGPFNNNNGDF
jgi:hypothetical protein